MEKIEQRKEATEICKEIVNGALFDVSKDLTGNSPTMSCILLYFLLVALTNDSEMGNLSFYQFLLYFVIHIPMDILLCMFLRLNGE